MEWPNHNLTDDDSVLGGQKWYHWHQLRISSGNWLGIGFSVDEDAKSQICETGRNLYVDTNVTLEGGLMYDLDQGAGLERICLSSPRAMVKEAFERIAKVFEDIS